MNRCTGPNGPETTPTSRRDFLLRAGGGFGMVALAALLADEGRLAADNPPAPDPLAPRRPHHPPRARNSLFQSLPAAPSRLRTFDPSPGPPLLAGQPLPASSGPAATRRNVARNRLLAPRCSFRKHGQSGTEIS